MGAADRIADTILRMGQIRAEGLQRSADIQARAQQNNAQIWSGALQSLGQLPVDIQKAKVLDTENQIRQNQLQQQKKFQDDEFNANQIYAYVTRPDQDGSVRFDEDKLNSLTQKMSEANVNPETQQRVTNAFKQGNAVVSEFRQQQLDHQVKVAKLVLGSATPENPLTPATALTTLKWAQANGIANTDDVNKFMAGLNQGHSPEDLFKAIAQYGTKPEEPIKLSDNDRLVQPSTGKVLVPSVPKPGEGQHVVNGQVIGPTGERIGEPVPPQVTPAQLETARHNQEMERIQGLQVGREAAASAETARHNRALENEASQRLKQDNSGAGQLPGENIPNVAPGQKNDAFLKTLPPPIADKVKALVEGRLPLPARFAKGDTYWQGLLDAAVKYDPSFDAANYNARNKARTDLTSPSGTGGKTINAMNTALQHAGRLSDLIEKLDNYDTPLANTVVNPLRSAAGSTAVTNFNAVAPQLMKEIERAWRGSGGSAGEIQELIKSIGPNMGKQQQREALGQFVELLQGKLDSTTQQRDAIMGPAAASIPVLFKNNEGVIDKILSRAGMSSEAAPPAAGSGPAATPAAGRTRVVGPNGETGTVPAGTALPSGWKLAK